MPIILIKTPQQQDGLKYIKAPLYRGTSSQFAADKENAWAAENLCNANTKRFHMVFTWIDVVHHGDRSDTAAHHQGANAQDCRRFIHFHDTRISIRMRHHEFSPKHTFVGKEGFLLLHKQGKSRHYRILFRVLFCPPSCSSHE